MPHAIFEQEGKYRVHEVDARGYPVGRPLTVKDSAERATKWLLRLDSPDTLSFAVPRELVAKACGYCAEQMDLAGLDELVIRDGKIEGKGVGADLLQGLCDVFSPADSVPLSVSVDLTGIVDEDTFDSFELFLYHYCSSPSTDAMLEIASGPVVASRLPGGAEVKSFPIFTGKAFDTGDERVKRQVFAVFGNIDSANDRIHMGATKKTVQEQMRRLRVLWQHDFDAPPVGVPLSVSEVQIAELPGEAMSFYREQFPEATGVLMADVKYLDTPRGNEVLEGINAGAIAENSIGFNVIADKTRFSNDNGRRVREIFEIRLWDLSPVNWGANDATLNIKRIGGVRYSESELVDRALAIETLAAEMKAGRVLSSSNLARLQAAIDSLQEILASAEPLETDSKSEPALTASVLRRLKMAEVEIALLTRGG